MSTLEYIDQAYARGRVDERKRVLAEIEEAKKGLLSPRDSTAEVWNRWLDALRAKIEGGER